MELLITLIVAVTVCSAYEPSHYGYHGPPAPIGHDGRVIDTPEVAYAKAAHLAALAEAASRASHDASLYVEKDVRGYHETDAHSAPIAQPITFHGFSEPVFFNAKTYHNVHGYHGPPAPLDHEGRVIDTPDVAKAKAAHFEAYSKIASNVGHSPLASYSETYDAPKYNAYYGPVAPLSHDGRVVDTPEVAHARAAHLAAYAHAAHGQYIK